MNIKILSDSTCDLPQELLEKYNISLVPLTIVKDAKSFSDGVDITPADIFAHVAAGGNLCSTAAVGVGAYEDWFQKFADDYDGVLHINISSEFSSSHQNARLAADMFDNVRVIDSRNLSTGQGLVVLKACELAKNCFSLDQLESEILNYIPKVEASFLIDKLEYMVKGGRCSAVAVLGANLLNIKPCIEVKDGKMSVVKKYRGSFEKCLASYIKDRLQNRDDLDDQTLFLTRTVVSDTALETVSQAVAESQPFQNTYWSEAGCTVSCHCGPGTFGVLFARK